jgi:hypothetical protein
LPSSKKQGTRCPRSCTHNTSMRMQHVRLQGHQSANYAVRHAAGAPGALFLVFARAGVCARVAVCPPCDTSYCTVDGKSGPEPTAPPWLREAAQFAKMQYVILHGHPSLRSERPSPTRRMCEMKRRRMRSYGAILTRRSALNGRHVLAGRRLEAARESAEQRRATGRKYIASARVTYSLGQV